MGDEPQVSDDGAGLTRRPAENLQKRGCTTAQTFGNNSDHLQRILRKVILPTKEFNAQLWEVVHPPLEPSSLRYSTLFISSTWSLSILTQLGWLFQAGKLSELLNDQIHVMENALLASVCLGFPCDLKAEELPTYGFERTSKKTAQRWAEEQKNKYTETLRSYLDISSKSIEPAEVSRRLNLLPDTSTEDQFILAHCLKVAAFSNVTPAGAIFDRLTVPEWSESIFRNLDPPALELLCDALLELALMHGEQWRTALPHIIASQILLLSDDQPRRSLLLAYCVLSSIATGTVGAIGRLLIDENRSLLERDLSYWKTRLEELFSSFSPWAQARLRPILSQLSSVQDIEDPADHDSLAGRGGDSKPM